MAIGRPRTVADTLTEEERQRLAEQWLRESGTPPGPPGTTAGAGESVRREPRDTLPATEIEDLETKIEELQAELSALEEIPLLNPYRGLSHFREEDSPFFFGREKFTAELVDSVANKSLVAVLGPSGSGKSSIVFAGLIPVLRR